MCSGRDDVEPSLCRAGLGAETDFSASFIAVANENIPLHGLVRTVRAPSGDGMHPPSDLHDHKLSCTALDQEERSALDRAAAQLAAIGAAASSDDERGTAWSGWADHCWRLGMDPSRVDTEVLDSYVADQLDASEARALRRALVQVGS